MRWEGERAWCPEILIAWEGGVMKKIGRRIEDLRIWAREGSEGIRSSSAFFERSQRKEDLTSLYLHSQGGDEVTGPKDEVIGSTDIAGLAGWIVKLSILLDIEIHTT
jgi:hypothetical protein